MMRRFSAERIAADAFAQQHECALITSIHCNLLMRWNKKPEENRKKIGSTVFDRCDA